MPSQFLLICKYSVKPGQAEALATALSESDESRLYIALDGVEVVELRALDAGLDLSSLTAMTMPVAESRGLLGMYAFGLEESGAYARAEETGRQALDGESLDCWAHHAVAHVMEMQGRAEDDLGWMIAREPYWAADDNLFKVHNWWHHAL